MLLNQKFTFLSNRNRDGRFNNPISMEQALLKDNIFSTQVNTAQASDLKTRAKTHNFLLKKVKNNKM